MPHVTIKLYPGRSEEQKQKLADAVAAQVATIAQCKPSSVSVALKEVEPADWAEQVYKPEVLGRADELYVRPGYNPLEKQGE